MPTDIAAVYARKRAAQAQVQGDITMALIFIIIWLANLVLLFADESFARATIEFMTLY
jgi:hypothetical protein